MKLRELIVEDDPFAEPKLTDEEEIRFLERKAASIFAYNQYIFRKWKIKESPPFFVSARGGPASVSFAELMKEFATSKDNKSLWGRTINTKLPQHVINRITKDAEITQLQAEAYPSLISKIKRLRQKLTASIVVDPSKLPAKIPIPGTTKAFNNPAVVHKEELYAGPASIFSWPGIPRAYFYIVMKFLKQHCNIDDFDIVYSGEGLQFRTGKERNVIIAVAAGGDIIWYCNNQWAGVLYFPDGNEYNVEESIKLFMHDSTFNALRSNPHVYNQLIKSIDDFKAKMGTK